MKARRFFGLLMLLVGAAPAGPAEHPLEQDLKQLGDRLQAEKKQLRKLLENSSAILNLLGHLERNIQELDRAARQSRDRLQEIKRLLELNASRRQQLEQSLEATRRRLGAWLREDYKSRRPFYETLGEGGRAGAVLERVRWQTGAAHRQAELVQGIFGMQLELQFEKRRLEQLAGEEKRALDELTVRQRELESAREKRLEMLRLVRREASLHKKALAEMEGARRQLTELLAQLEGRPGAGRGFSTWQGRLPPPVKGAKIEVAFGLVEDETFHTRTRHPGVDLRAEPGTPVSPVYPGTVAYAGWLDGYGLLVILDHGGGYFTLYAHLENLAVKRGERITAGDELGRLGDTGSIKGHYLYFEVREKGRAVDPQQWIKW